MSQHWDEYWQQGHLTSFGDSFSGNYAGILKDIWFYEFESLPNQFEVLDIATGNGALPLLINHFFSTKDVSGHVDGIDLAKINTDLKHCELSKAVGITLTSNIDCNKLPFKNEKYDLVISQYGIEYSKLALSIPEALRVLKPGGHLSVVTHHHQSMIINRNRSILEIVSNEEAYRLFDVVIELVSAMGVISSAEDLARVKADSNCEGLRKELNQLISVLGTVDESALKDSEMLTYVATIFQKGLYWSLNKKLEYISFAIAQISALRQRLRELVDSALNEVDISNFLSMFLDGSASLEDILTLRDENNNILAWKITAVKAEQARART